MDRSRSRRLTSNGTIRLIRAVGHEHTDLVISKEQADGPQSFDDLKGLIVGLGQGGVTGTEIDPTVRRNPARLLRLGDAVGSGGTGEAGRPRRMKLVPPLSAFAVKIVFTRSR